MQQEAPSCVTICSENFLWGIGPAGAGFHWFFDLTGALSTLNIAPDPPLSAQTRSGAQGVYWGSSAAQMFNSLDGGAQSHSVSASVVAKADMFRRDSERHSRIMRAGSLLLLIVQRLMCVN
jgi:hypothetical protein